MTISHSGLLVLGHPVLWKIRNPLHHRNAHQPMCITACNTTNKL